MTAGILGGIVAGLAPPEAIRFAGLVPLAIGALAFWRGRRPLGVILAGLGLLILIAG
ncbi:hypothetical protein [Kutzneria sp. CA-103260]|uniref:hypothetical protein n=1 Tax=Kutzneria sp. CA-103260 TaxID=2802641 RepID=UPI001BA9DD1A|nr:hypothetical protein [Kutzneria sp. CA-103260]QUQ63055.1 hypothetical protein JJ691_07670 [Kutzneria sp. CA-103260]